MMQQAALAQCANLCKGEGSEFCLGGSREADDF